MTLNQIKRDFPPYLQTFERNMLREYLQCKILQFIFESVFAMKLSFLGDTALRIVHENTRFSEDLDFDNFGLEEAEFTQLSQYIQRSLERQGALVEMRTVFKGAYRCSIKLPRVLFDNQLSPYQNEKILIHIDTAPQRFTYTPERKVLSRFDIVTAIFCTPLDVLLSQKIFAAVDRNTPKGRDFYDILFLLARTKPNYEYLRQKMGIESPEMLRDRLVAYSSQLDMEKLGHDVEPFLFHAQDVKKIILFTEYIQQANLGGGQ